MQISGEYQLQGIHEMACGIVLYENFNFDFYLIYGALDRHGYGTWQKISDTEIELNTDYKNVSPFTIFKEEKKNTDDVTLSFPDYNKILMQETKVEVFTDDKKYEEVLNTEGVCSFAVKSVDKIIITCMFYFDNPAILFPSAKENNSFVIQPNHNLPLVHFQNMKMKTEQDTLKGVLHVLDPNKEFTFQKY